ncbi:MAG: pilus assembly protein PilM [Candidatus Ratteibacteria bacterium]|jgi:type IV pilus assembly protein PilM
MIGKQKILAVDIGTSHIRTLELSIGRKGPVITHYEEFDAPPFPVDQRLSVLRTEGKPFFRALPSRRAFMSLPGRGILTRPIVVPRVPINKLRDILKYEIQQQIPFPLEVVAWAYQIISETDKNFNILICAAKKDLVNEYLGHLIPLGLSLESLDTDLFAIYNLFRFSPSYQPGKCQAILEVGAQTSNLVITHQEKMLMRALTTSGDTITTAISEAQTIEFPEAEKLKREQGCALPMVTSILESLHTELQNSFDYWRFTLKGSDIEELFICGGTSQMEGYKAFFEEKTKLPTFYLNPLEYMEVAPDFAESVKEKGPELATLCGIALKLLDTAVVDIDMLPTEILRMREFKENRIYMVLSLAMAVLLSVTPLFFISQQKVALQNFGKEVELSLQEYEKYKPEVERLQKGINETKGNIGVVKGLMEKKFLWLARILEIGNSLPSSRIFLSKITPAGSGGDPAAEPHAPEEMPPNDMGRPPDEGPPPPGMPPPEGGPPPEEAAPPAVAGALPSSIAVLNIEGEAIVTDVKSAFKDFKLFVQKLQQLEYCSQVVIESCELNRETNRLAFLLTFTMK